MDIHGFTVKDLSERLKQINAQYRTTYKSYGSKQELFDRFVEATERIATAPAGVVGAQDIPVATVAAAAQKKSKAGRPSMGKQDPTTPFTMADMAAWSGASLKEALRHHNAAVSGSKAVLAQRLADLWAKKPVEEFGQRGVRTPKRVVKRDENEDVEGNETDEDLAPAPPPGPRQDETPLPAPRGRLTPGRTPQRAPVVVPAPRGGVVPVIPRTAAAPKIPPRLLPQPSPRLLPVVAPRPTTGPFLAPIPVPAAGRGRRVAAPVPRVAKKVRLFFGEPTDIHVDYLRDAKRLEQGYLEVTDDFYSKILAGPRKYGPGEEDHCTGEGNGYLFGPLFPADEYELLYSHETNTGKTGFIHVDDALIKNLSPEEAQWDMVTQNDDWDEKDVLIRLQRTHPEIVWLGRTLRGYEVGSSLFVHHDASGNIDSMFIENQCLFDVPRTQ